MPGVVRAGCGTEGDAVERYERIWCWVWVVAASLCVGLLSTSSGVRVCLAYLATGFVLSLPFATVALSDSAGPQAKAQSSAVAEPALLQVARPAAWGSLALVAALALLSAHVALGLGLLALAAASSPLLLRRLARASRGSEPAQDPPPAA